MRTLHGTTGTIAGLDSHTHSLCLAHVRPANRQPFLCWGEHRVQRPFQTRPGCMAKSWAWGPRTGLANWYWLPAERAATYLQACLAFPLA